MQFPNSNEVDDHVAEAGSARQIERTFVTTRV